MQTTKLHHKTNNFNVYFLSSEIIVITVTECIIYTLIHYYLQNKVLRFLQFSHLFSRCQNLDIMNVNVLIVCARLFVFQNIFSTQKNIYR